MTFQICFGKDLLVPVLGARFVVYEKGIEGDVDIAAPSELGGLKSEEFLRLNPHGKVGVPTATWWRGRFLSIARVASLTLSADSTICISYAPFLQSRRGIQ